MTTSYRLGGLLLWAAIAALVVNSQASFAQRIKIGGSNQNSNNKKDKDNDDEERVKDKNKDNQNNQNGGSKSNDANTQQKIQQFLDRKQGGQNGQGQGGSNQNRGSNRPGQFPGQFPSQQQQIQKFSQQDDDNNKNFLKLGTWRGDQWQGSRKIDNWTKVFGNNQQPFSSNWYKDHPQAWKYDNNKSNVWVVATLPGVYTWLGWGNMPQQYQADYGNGPQFDPSRYGDWYPLGVYSLMAGEDDMGTRVVQLAIDRRGRIAGNYYDLITNSNYNVSGDVDRQSQRAIWSLNKNQYVRFRASIMRLLQPYGTVTVQLPGGDQRWQFVRLEN